MANCIAWLRYDEDEEVWVAKHSQYKARQAEKVFRAISHAPKKSLLLGTSLWTIYNDTKACSPNGTYSAWLTMTACNDTEYTCASGNCVPMEQRSPPFQAARLFSDYMSQNGSSSVKCKNVRISATFLVCIEYGHMGDTLIFNHIESLTYCLWAKRTTVLYRVRKVGRQAAPVPGKAGERGGAELPSHWSTEPCAAWPPEQLTARCGAPAGSCWY